MQPRIIKRADFSNARRADLAPVDYPIPLFVPTKLFRVSGLFMVMVVAPLLWAPIIAAIWWATH